MFRKLMALSLFLASCDGAKRSSSPYDNPAFPVSVTTIGMISSRKDNVLFTGDSITFRGMSRMFLPGFSELVSEVDPSRYPGYVDGAIGGSTSVDAQLTLDALLAAHPGASYVTLAYGTNDMHPANQVPPDLFKSSIRSLIVKILAAGMVPVIPSIPFATHPSYSRHGEYNQCILELNAEFSLKAGPDLYGWFLAHPNELAVDGIHPNEAGYRSINLLWAKAMVVIFNSGQ